MSVVDVKHVTRCFGTGDVRVEALRGVDLRVERGEFVAVMGPSGSGKSTLLAILGGVDVPTGGQVLVEGTDLASLSDDARTEMRRRRIGFIFQSFNLLPNLTAAENVSLPLELDGTPGREAHQRALAALEKVEMTQRQKHTPGKLSGGEQQRVAIARALVIEPAILLADEPTGNLDSRQSQLVSGLLRQLVDEHQQTIVMVTHDRQVASVADRLVSLRDGFIESDERQSASSPAPQVAVKDPS